MKSSLKIQKLMDKGVSIPNPETVIVGDDVNIDRISGSGTVVYSGCKIFGKNTLILNDVKLGYEAPVTIENCHIGPGTELKGGFFQRAVFLKNVSMGYGSHVREGTILEEETSVAHTVGLKQTILFPYVTLGSLINFCDCLMSGGTSREDHSEVGSSFIHFNYTPNQDKATPSMMGNVPQGVMLNQKPIFLGGQGGIVGPVRFAFGIITAAGTICRKDELRPSRMILTGVQKNINIPFTPGKHLNIKRTVLNNLLYIANLFALNSWYHHVRSEFISDDFPEELLEGLKEKLEMNIRERIRRLRDLPHIIHNAGYSDQRSKELQHRWSEIESVFDSLFNYIGEQDILEDFKIRLRKGREFKNKDYIGAIRVLNKEDAGMGSNWLQGIIDHIFFKLSGIIPSFSFKVETK
ncbi:MAG: protein GlmU [Deltaproteobacteria bacterium]|nr:protein GlmU [Deltaproteobacteria bacterium]